MFNSIEKIISRCSAQPTVWGFQIITLGMHKINLGTGEAAKSYNIEHIPIGQALVHPKYNKSNLDYDILMIQLQWVSKLYAGDAVPVDTLMDSLVLSSTSGADLVVIGFGTLASGGATPNVMQEVVIDYVSNAECIRQPYGYSSSQITLSMMCAGRSGKDSCQVCSLWFMHASETKIPVHSSTNDVEFPYCRVTRVVLSLT
jgi:secreted trypsin-like serine protease